MNEPTAHKYKEPIFSRLVWKTKPNVNAMMTIALKRKSCGANACGTSIMNSRIYEELKYQQSKETRTIQETPKLYFVNPRSRIALILLKHILAFTHRVYELSLISYHVLI